jgi:hypothetical protein
MRASPMRCWGAMDEPGRSTIVVPGNASKRGAKLRNSEAHGAQLSSKTDPLEGYGRKLLSGRDIGIARAGTRPKYFHCDQYANDNNWPLALRDDSAGNLRANWRGSSPLSSPVSGRAGTGSPGSGAKTEEGDSG